MKYEILFSDGFKKSFSKLQIKEKNSLIDYIQKILKLESLYFLKQFSSLNLSFMIKLSR